MKTCSTRPCAGSGGSLEECPAKLRMNNGPELVSVALADWAEKRGVDLEFIQPSKPTQAGDHGPNVHLLPG